MRFADRPTASASIEINATLDTVWTICTDLGRFGEWSPENRGGEWIDGATEASPGAAFRGTQERPGIGRWETVCHVTVFDPPRRFEWRLGDPEHPGAVWGFDLSPGAAPTTTLLTQSVQMGPGPSGATAAIERMPDKEEKIIERRLADYDAGMRAVLAGIKTAAETAGEAA